MTEQPRLTKRQSEALQALAEFWRLKRAPNSGELLTKLNLGSVNSLDNLLHPLEAKGFLSIERGVRGRQRLIEPTSLARSVVNLGLPVLGEIPGGPIAEAIRECEEWLDDVPSLFKPCPGDFGLRLKGESMIGDGLLTGDRILLRPNIEWRPGEIVAAQIHDEADPDVILGGTLKHLDVLDEGKTVRLRASNPDFAPMYYDARLVSVAGVYRGMIRVVE